MRAQIFPPKYYPGEVVDFINDGELNVALEDVMRAGSLMQNRRCAIAVANQGSLALTNGRSVSSFYFLFNLL